jgi:hypothetical protein
MDSEKMELLINTDERRLNASSQEKSTSSCGLRIESTTANGANIAKYNLIFSLIFAFIIYD